MRRQGTLGFGTACLALGTLALGTLALGPACIIPDQDIDIRPTRVNPGAVRIVQAIALTDPANQECTEASVGFAGCPIPPVTLPPPGLIALEGQEFCLCPQGQRDVNAVGSFDIFVEDPDKKDDGSALDEIFGTFLLDMPAGAETPSDYVAYTNYLPTRPAVLVPLGLGTYAQPIERPKTNLKRWVLGGETRVDLCNNNNATALEPGLHSLRLIVTDRPWYVPVAVDSMSGQPMREGPNDYARLEQPALVGVPDLPGGASYAQANFVFNCSEDNEAESVCGCEGEEMGEG